MGKKVVGMMLALIGGCYILFELNVLVGEYHLLNDARRLAMFLATFLPGPAFLYVGVRLLKKGDNSRE